MARLNLNLDLAALQEQFQGLQGRHPGLWPQVPRALLLIGVFLLIVALGWGLYWRGLFEELEVGQMQEEKLKAEYQDKIKQAVNLAVLRKQKEHVLQYVSQLEKQLPSRAEMDALLSDINQAGVGRGLQFELFKPGQVVAKEYYAELPINVRLIGTYHDLGAFTSDIANMPRIVTLNNLQIVRQEKTGQLTLDAVAKTFRYLDPEEVQQQRAAAAKRKEARK
ncbi:MAG TPA: type 4a pilus biogenesis protein PilO [Burkholderiaceae bacterium]|jgi:type IV pilus assembly protein PilO|nr:type 4a pilus biogenesis protein PilO [Burkholderiaceae bacterium]